MEIEFVNILEVDKDTQMAVREWRNSEEVKKYMFNDTEITIEEHNSWVNSLINNKKNTTFIVFYKNTPVGIVSITNINYVHKTADWGFYIYDTTLRGKGLGKGLLYKLICYAFSGLNLSKLNCEALENNPAVINLYKKFGFIEEGIRRKNIIKDGKRLDVVLLGILKEEWEQKKPEIEELLRKI